jgi:hypothetical protein
MASYAKKEYNKLLLPGFVLRMFRAVA